MSENRYVVPDGMVEATWWSQGMLTRDEIRRTLGATLRWMAENPIVPSDDEISQIERATSGICNLPPQRANNWRAAIVEFQRRMFVPPEPQVPGVTPRIDPQKCPHRWQAKNDLTTMQRVVYCELCEWEYSREILAANTPPEPQDNSQTFISKLQGYTFTPEEAAKIKHAIDTSTHPRTVNGFDEHLSTEATPFQTPYPRYSAVESLQDGYPSIDSDGHYQCQVCATRIDHLGNCQRHSSESDIVDLMNRRMVEYSDWVHTNLQNLFDKKPLAPRLEWDKRGRKVFTYADVVKTKRPTYCVPGTWHPFDPSHRECPGCEPRKAGHQ